MALAAAALIVLLVLVAVFAPLVVKLVGARPPNDQSGRYLDSFGAPTGPSSHNIFGVDPLGRDVFSRVVYGARVSLEVAIVATAISVALGVVVGMIAGYYRGWRDTLLSRLIDVLLAFPILLLALGIGASCSLGNGCLGGLIQPGLSVVTLIIPTNILFEAALSFLGVGVQPPDPSWGAMIADATDTFDTTWWYMVFPGAALLLTVLAFNLLGDGLQDALNPRAGKS